jgi:two-component system CheB/CheR fusion protein
MTTRAPLDETVIPGPVLSLADAAPVDDLSQVRGLPFPTVAIGASAGGVEALQRFFRSTPPGSGCAYIVLMHLNPDRESMLAELLGRATPMPVVQAGEDMPIEVEHVYIVPPGQYVEVHEGRLVLSKIVRRPPKPKVVDHFMISLAHDERERAIAVVLTGIDGDGALGVKAIKSEGGMTLAQKPETAAHAGMPQSAVDTGMVDAELAIEQMPAAIIEYVATARLRRNDPPPDVHAASGILSEVLAEVRNHSGLDFRGYKTPMLIRRVRRRMGLARIAVIGDYIKRLRSKPEETAALTADFLISVTEFFREPEAWRALSEEILPQIFEHKSEGDTVRAWVPACATGEEAYSLAMLLLEHPRTDELHLKVQVFATDVDRRALDLARAGAYSTTIESAVSPERRGRFFVKQGDHYQVRKQLREAVLFAPHNLTSDPPFSHMDLVSCRNLLIYMEPELQRRVLQVFHFSLDPDCFLFLGKSETIGSLVACFVPASQRSRIYRRIGTAHERANGIPMTPQPVRGDTAHAGHPAKPVADYARLIRDALLESRLAAGILADRDGHALYFYGPVQSYLVQPQGVPTSDLYALLNHDLSPHVRVVMHRTATDRTAATAVTVRNAKGEEESVRIAAQPLPHGNGTDNLVLLTFERTPLMGAPLPPASPSELTALRAMEDELRNTKRELRTAIEELEATNEELRVANEEAMSMNEELQSSNEELETSKEELQSINEELSTVNHQLQEKVEELESANNDLGNLLSSTHIPTLFLDRQLRIRRFTPAATQLFRLIPSDVNRPLTDIAGRTDMRTLLDDAQEVLAQLAPIQQEAASDDGHVYLRRTLPYRTREDRIDGIVVTFTDVTELKQANEGLRRLATVVQSSNDAIIMLSPAGDVLAWNAGAATMYGYAEADTLGKPIAELLPVETRSEFEQHLQRSLAGQSVQAALMQRRTRSGAMIDVSSSFSPVRGDDGKPTAVALIERDVTSNKRAADELRQSEARFRTLADSAPVLIWLTDEQGRLTFCNRGCEIATEQPAAALLGRRWTDLLHPDDLPRVQTATWRAQREGGDGRVETTARLVLHSGTSRWFKIIALQRGGQTAEAGGLVGCMFDIHAHMAAEEALRQADRRKDEFLAMLGHELRNPLVPIRNAAEVLTRLESTDARVQWVRDTLVRQVGHVTRLVDDLLDISRVTRGTMSLHLEPVKIADVLPRAIDAVRPLLERKHQRFEVETTDEPLWVEGDAIRLAQIFENLLTNAAKYTEEGGQIRLSLEREDDCAVVHVRDNGIGIDPSVQSRMFELFVQDTRSIDRSQGGLGIGLALVRHLVELHGGRVDAQSPGVGKGSDFVVSIPLLPASAIPAQRQATPATEASGGRVLLIDDDIDGAESLAVLLKLSGFEIEVAHDLEAGLRTAARQLPHVVILDLAMPGADGFEVARRLRALPGLEKTQYIALSGFGSSEDVARSKHAGFVKHFVKPADPDEIQALLTQLVAAQQGTGHAG